MSTKPQRIYSIDMLKGICMIGMLIDHWRDHVSRMSANILGTANPLPVHADLLEHFDTASFWLRCTSGYFVAPAFLFLAGAGCYLWKMRRGSEQSLFIYLLTRGSMLAIVNCLLFFHKPFSEGGSITLHVLWPTGIGMILLGCIATWPKKILWFIALVCIAGQNIFQDISLSYFPISTLWSLGFVETTIPLPWGASLYNLWPIMPWFGILLLGYLCGSLFLQGQKSFSTWLKLGASCLVFFLFLRLTGLYGDTNLWHMQDTLLKTLGNIITVTKYPPSLQYTLYGLGITFLFLALLERYQLTNRMLIIFGSTPLFFYIMHTIMMRGAKFILLHLPTPIIENIKIYLFSINSVLIGTCILMLLLWFLCEQYIRIMKNLRTKKQQTA